MILESKKYCIYHNMLNINSFTIFFVCSTWGGWEPKSSQHLLVTRLRGYAVTRLRGYAVTRMLLYNQLYPRYVTNSDYKSTIF